MPSSDSGEKMRFDDFWVRVFCLEQRLDVGVNTESRELWLGFFVALMTSYALLLAGMQLFDLMQDDAAGAFAGGIDMYYSYYGEITSRHGILETLFRHVASDVSIQTARMLVVLLGVFPASLAMYLVASRVLRLEPSAAVIAGSVPFLLSVQNVIPFSYNSSYTVFDLASLAVASLILFGASRTGRIEILAPSLIFLAFTISEAMNNAPFLTPTLFALAALLHWRSVIAKIVSATIIIAATGKVLRETVVDRMGSTPNARDDLNLIAVAEQFFSNFLATTDSMVGLGEFGAFAILLASLLTAAVAMWSWLKSGDRQLILATAYSAALLYVPLVGFAAAADGFQLRYAFYSHVGLALLFGVWLTVLVRTIQAAPLPKLSENLVTLERVGRYAQCNASSVLLVLALLGGCFVAYTKSQPTAAQSAISAQLEQYATFFQRPPARSVRTARTYQYLILADGGGLRSSLLPLATAFGYIQFVTANPQAIGWIGPVDSCGDPFGQGWRYWGRANLPSGLSPQEPLWVVGSNGRFGRMGNIEYLLASEVSDPTARLGDAPWRLYSVGDHDPELVAAGEGESNALAAMARLELDPQMVALNCGLRRTAANAGTRIPTVSGTRMSAEFAPANWTSTGLAAPTATFDPSGLLLGPDQHAVYMSGLLVRQGQRVTLSYRAEAVDPIEASALSPLRVGPVGRDENGVVTYWWSPAGTAEKFLQAARAGGVEITGSRTVTVPADVETLHIAFHGPLAAEGQGAGQVRITEAVIVIE